MVVKRCDRCGKNYENNNLVQGIIPRIGLEEKIIGIGLMSDQRIYSRKYDLCDDCVKDFKKWIKTRRDDEYN